MLKKVFTIYLLFVFVPIALLLEYLVPNQQVLIFFTAALSIVPIARLISEATENIAQYTGNAVGGILNASFGNLPEFIIILISLKSGLYSMVLASLIGGILANLLLANGLSFFLGGLKYHTQDYNPISSRIYSSMMFIAVVSMVVPSTFSNLFTQNVVLRDEYILNIGLSIGLLVTYLLYLVFMLKTHPDYFKNRGPVTENTTEEKPWALKNALILLSIASVLAALMAELLVGSVETTGKALGMSTIFIGMIVLAIIGGAAESLSAISMARKNKMDLSLGIAFESCIQIALFIAPLALLSSYFVGPKPMNLNFSGVQMGVLFLAVLMGIIVTGDGKSNWYKGIQLLFIYFTIAILFYFMPV